VLPGAARIGRACRTIRTREDHLWVLHRSDLKMNSMGQNGDHISSVERSSCKPRQTSGSLLAANN
jgi:hypothetical protein